MTSVNPLRLYIYEEGLTRFATQKYTDIASGGNKKANKYMHLTNFSINKKNINFVKTDGEDQDGQGSKWSISELRRQLQQQGIDDTIIWRKIEDICIKTVISAEPYIFQAMKKNVPHSDSCFELLGFDILIDSILEPWLIEVNLSCSLGCDSALDQRVKAALVADLLTLVGVTPLDKRKQGAEAASFKNPHIGMYYGGKGGGGKSTQNSNKANNRCNTQDIANRKSNGINSKAAQMRSTSRRDDALGNAMNTMQGTFISDKKQQLEISQKDQLEVVKDTEMEFRRR